jgi:hypothetical protein
MPSNRRVKVLSIALVLALFALLYLSSSASSDAEFYDKTVAGLESRARQAAEAAHLAPPKGQKPPTEHVQRPLKAPGDASRQGTNEKGTGPQVVDAATTGDETTTSKEGPGKASSSESDLDKERTPPQVGQGRTNWAKGADVAQKGEEVIVEDEATVKTRRVDATLNDILKKGPSKRLPPLPSSLRFPSVPSDFVRVPPSPTPRSGSLR